MNQIEDEVAELLRNDDNIEAMSGGSIAASSVSNENVSGGSIAASSVSNENVKQVGFSLKILVSKLNIIGKMLTKLGYAWLLGAVNGGFNYVFFKKNVFYICFCFKIFLLHI
ncbi:uncharacterized protein LOC124809889 isoform X2 [Hydra vulgaris]|uniref:uncharacterized protein LOC124809889 isoform X2 n=1 Tax=Hydra vulgaris TaxID=6087 RepID=UPI0032EA0687